MKILKQLKLKQYLFAIFDQEITQFYDVQNCNSVQIVHSTYAEQKAKLLNYFATALKYQPY